MYDVFLIADKSLYEEDYKRLKQSIPTVKCVKTIEQAQQSCVTKFLWVVYPDLEIDPNFYFDYVPDDWSHDYVHLFLNDNEFDGISLIPKNLKITQREVDYRFYSNKKFVDIVASKPKPFDYFEIDNYDEYCNALEQSKTQMFWMGSKNISQTDLVKSFYITHHNASLRKQNHAFVHQVDDKKLYNGLFLCSKDQPLTQKEVDYRFPVARKEWNEIGSGPAKYEIYFVNSYEDYLKALAKSEPEMIYGVPNHTDLDDNYTFDEYFTFDNEYDRKINHVYLNGEYHDGVVLCSKHSKISQREWHFMFIANKKEHNKIVSKPKPYDIVFISYQEPNADENYKRILKRFPECKRIHGVKGIHQAHIEAAKICTTPMFWIIDGDADIVEDFNFDYQVPVWQWDHVHVWRSRNPINGLVYGYGGVKLFPRELTLTMDTSKPDMTTSISTKFKAIQQISNVTAFNTGEFETWKSAFRECCKLSSKVIDRQKEAETDTRLKIWSSVGKDKPYGEYAIKGAKEGTMYGTTNKGNIDALKLINDFDWLREKFNGHI